MSKLNDSTLKILKKYRLDTDMSVFGNENKLYDVVKVMDDMVGNQVSNKAGTALFWDSLVSSSRYHLLLNSNSATYTPYQRSNDKFTTTATKQLCFDALTYKYVYNNVGGQYALVAKVHRLYFNEKCADSNLFCYIFYDKNNNLFKLFYDISAQHECTDINLGSSWYGFTQFVYFSDETVSAFACTPWDIFKKMFPDATFSTQQWSETGGLKTDAILLPSEINFSPYYIMSTNSTDSTNLSTNIKKFIVEV